MSDDFIDISSIPIRKQNSIKIEHLVTEDTDKSSNKVELFVNLRFKFYLIFFKQAELFSKFVPNKQF